MRTKRVAHLGVLVGLMALLLAAGCSHDDNGSRVTNPTGADAGDQTINLEDPYGGFNAAVEDPAFGDESLVDAALMEQTEDDGYEGLSADERRAALNEEDRPDRDFYAFTIMWGNLDARDRDDVQQGGYGVTVDWSGSLTLEEGSIRLVSLIGFELGEDYLLRPRQARNEIAWQSLTHGEGDIDGLRVTLIVPSEPDLGSTDMILRLRMLPLGDEPLEFSLGQLADLEQIISVPNGAGQLSIRAFKAEAATSVRGYLGGRWGYVLEDSTVEGDSVVVRGFKGRWISDSGEMLGFVRGHYGRDLTGERVFFGKYIDEQGAFRGFVRGRWWIEARHGEESDADYHEVGVFAGGWTSATGEALGEIKGHWSRRGQRPGTFSGLWRGFELTP